MQKLPLQAYSAQWNRLKYVESKMKILYGTREESAFRR